MTKKIGDMTLREIVRTCENHPGCEDCPLGADGIDFKACLHWWEIMGDDVLDLEVPT